jgi:integrase/recombinase XerD
MGTLRNKMIDAMNLRRFSLRTHESYLGAVSALARYYNLPPDKIDAQQLQAYVLHLTVERGLSWSTCNVAVSAFRFFYVEVLGRERTNLPMPPRKKPTKLPEVLSRQELDRLFACARPLRNRTLLMTTYAAGLRVSEVTSLRVSDIDSKRMMIRVEQGKGAKDRYTILSPRLLEELRAYWKLHQPHTWLFPATRDSSRKMDSSMAQKIYYVTKHRAAITRGHGIHTLRHFGFPLAKGFSFPCAHSALSSVASSLTCSKEHSTKISFDSLGAVLLWPSRKPSTRSLVLSQSRSGLSMLRGRSLSLTKFSITWAATLTASPYPTIASSRWIKVASLSLIAIAETPIDFAQ